TQFNAEDPFSSQILRDKRLNPSVVNISQTFPPGSGRGMTALETLIFGDGQRAGFHNRRVIVAAAGVTNDDSGGMAGKMRQNGCDFYPACWSARNGRPNSIISVVALNSRGSDILKIDDR